MSLKSDQLELGFIKVVYDVRYQTIPYYKIIS